MVKDCLRNGPAALIPLPKSLMWESGEFVLGSVIAADTASMTEAAQLAAMLEPATGFTFKIIKAEDARKSSERLIILRQDYALASGASKESYSLNVSTDNVRLIGASSAGVFHGIQTLRQLLPVEIFASTVQSGVSWRIPCVEILDEPRYAWRGFMLDESRHIIGADYIRKLIDLMAMHKLNVFHWHLSDDDGWRIEIKAYPKLTEVGGWRGSQCAVPNTRPGETHEHYGGFYTQEQIREIVAYAAARHVRIVPEIDVPGHSLAAIAAYPEILCENAAGTAASRGVKANVWCAGREENYRMLGRIVSELADLFPGECIHIGGDEVKHDLWQNCPRCQALAAAHGFSGGAAIQNYFVGRMEKIVQGLGCRTVGWNEIFNTGLAADTAIMAWTAAGPGYEAIRQGWDTVFVPGASAYFDMKESPSDTFGHTWAGVVSLDKVHALDPDSEPGLTSGQKARILGVHSCLWTEFVTDASKADYKIWPRLCALAEVGWTPQPSRDFTGFMNRLAPAHLERLAYRDVQYRVPDGI